MIMCNFMNQLIENDLYFSGLIELLQRKGWWQETKWNKLQRGRTEVHLWPHTNTYQITTT